MMRRSYPSPPPIEIPLVRQGVTCTGPLRSRLVLEIDVTPSGDPYGRLYMPPAPQGATPVHEGHMAQTGPGRWEIVDASNEPVEFVMADAAVEVRLGDAKRKARIR